MLAVYKNIDGMYRGRIQRGLTQQDLARTAGVSVNP